MCLIMRFVELYDFNCIYVIRNVSYIPSNRQNHARVYIFLVRGSWVPHLNQLLLSDSQRLSLNTCLGIPFPLIAVLCPLARTGKGGPSMPLPTQYHQVVQLQYVYIILIQSIQGVPSHSLTKDTWFCGEIVDLSVIEVRYPTDILRHQHRAHSK